MNKMINIKNYEAYLLDYIEGNLDSSQEAELLSFLNQHPELGKDIVDPDSYKIVPPATGYNNNESLKKANNHSYLMISHVEKSLTAFEQRELDSLLSDDAMKSELEMYHRCKLSADSNIKYYNKNKLKKAVVFVPNKLKYAIAATIALVIISGLAINWFIETSANLNQKGLALYSNIDFEKTLHRINNPDNQNTKSIVEINTAKTKANNTDCNDQNNIIKKVYTPVTLLPMSKIKPKIIEIEPCIAQLKTREIPELYEYQTITITYKKGNEKEDNNFRDYFNKLKDINGPVKLLKSQKQELLSLNQ